MGKRIAVLILVLCCLPSLAIERAAMASGNAGAKILDSNDDDLPDEAKNASADAEEVQAACTRITALLNGRRYDEAQRLLAQTTAAAPKSLAVKRLYAYMYLYRNQPAAAAKVMEELQKMGSLTSADKVLAGTAYWRLGALPKALENFREAVAMDQSNPATEETYIRCMLANKEWADVVAECDKGLARFKTASTQKSLQAFRAQASNEQTKLDDDARQIQGAQTISPFFTRSPGG